MSLSLSIVAMVAIAVAAVGYKTFSTASRSIQQKLCAMSDGIFDHLVVTIKNPIRL